MTRIRLTELERSRFGELGYLGPVPVFGRRECRRLNKLLKTDDAAPLDWPKGKATSSRLHYEVACSPGILNRVAALLDGPVMLWGSSLVTRLPGQKHAWHTDIETHRNEAGMVSVWIALEGTGRSSALELIERSHLLGSPLQQVAANHQTAGNKADHQTIDAWARALKPDCSLVQADIRDGQAIFFDGRIWHGSANANKWLPRRALLLQYARPDIPIRMPDPNHLQWPVSTIEHPRPPCIMVLGSTIASMNRIVPPPVSPAMTASPTLSSIIRPIDYPMAEDLTTGWRAEHLFAGQSAQLVHQHGHVSILSAGATPHDPHQHIEEEILVMLSGQAELSIVNDNDRTERRELLQAGDFVYYPATGAHHTLTNRSASPATYLMFKWHDTRSSQQPDHLPPDVQYTADAFHRAQQRDLPFATGLLLEGPTAFLSRLHAHVSVVQPGGGYEAHVDAHDVAIVLLEGQIETLGETMRAPAMAYISGGHAHGLNNTGTGTARYLVFEFEGRRSHRRLTPPLDAAGLKRWVRQKARALISRSAFAEGLVRRLIAVIRRY